MYKSTSCPYPKVFTTPFYFFLLGGLLYDLPLSGLFFHNFSSTHTQFRNWFCIITPRVCYGLFYCVLSLYYTNKQGHLVFVLLTLTYLTWHLYIQFHPHFSEGHDFTILQLHSIHFCASIYFLYVYVPIYLFVHVSCHIWNGSIFWQLCKDFKELSCTYHEMKYHFLLIFWGLGMSRWR